MESILLEKAQLLALLDLMGIDEVIGLEPEQLHHPEPYERPLILDDGRSRLLEQKVLAVADDHYEIERELEAMLAVVGDPGSVLRVHRSTPDQSEEFWCWYFISGEDLIQLATSSPEQFELERISDLQTIVTQINEILPLETVPNDVHYHAVADQEDVDAVRTLVNDWDEVPALTVMEADGLMPVEAMELYDDMSEPQWRGQVDFMACSSGQVALNHRLLVLQGQKLAWLGWQRDPDRSDLHIQTATAGAFEEHLRQYLDEVVAK